MKFVLKVWLKCIQLGKLLVKRGIVAGNSSVETPTLTKQKFCDVNFTC